MPPDEREFLRCLRQCIPCGAFHAFHCVEPYCTLQQMQRESSPTALNEKRSLPPNRLREVREAHGLMRYDIAARFRVDQSTVGRWEKALSPVPDTVKLDLAELYGVTPAYLMGWPEQAAA